MLLLKGQKIDITKGRSLSKLAFQFGWWAANDAMSIDAACFVLSEGNRCEREEDFIFYGNPSAQSGALTHVSLNGADKEAVKLSLSALPSSAAKIAFTVTIYEGEKHGYGMKDTSDMYLRLINEENGEELFRYEYGSDLSKETAIVVGELYKHNGEWKFNAIGSGFYGGLAALCTNFGLEIEEDSAQEAAAAVEETVMSTIDLRKKIVGITLEKKGMTQVAARVGLVLDISGSMLNLYKNGTVQEVVERILAVACKFDDDGVLDIWVYDNEYSRLPSATEKDFEHYVLNHIMNNKKIHKFGRNNEPPVMEDVIRKYTQEEDSALPVFIIFINDGGVAKSIKKVITESAVQPIFWQFVGIGNSDFEVLKRLDTMEGRIVDNANFIHIKDVSAVSDETLYSQLLNEFPLWLKEATDKRIIRA
ncbi:hypothetical protein PAECIP111893_01423 [Paenibacillus plantiphilus]|uniref:VWFA domain-containing protein n=2 Tax=Paenibacillus plantiphilus TaxID=2905650 RepID=A0ABM9C0Y6_9BACL|nr:hypothetical protein PAECIP111893_01423 [Paenibacillus plantiphilus]